MRSRQSQPISPLVLPVSALRGFVFPKSKRTVAVSLVASILLTVGGVEGVGRAGCGRERGGGNRMRLQCRQRTKMGQDWMEDAGCELHCGVAWALLPTPVSCPSDSPVCTLQISLPQCYKRNAWRNRGQEQHLNGQEQSWV